MKRIIYFCLAAAMIFGMISCEKVDHAKNQKITYFPSLELEGGTVLLDKGGTYNEPGYHAELKGEDATDQVVVKNPVDVNKSGVYTITYSIANEDGFDATATRTVIVTDPADPVEGAYMTDPASYRLYNGAQVAYGRSFMIVILAQGGGKYSIDDLLGGWYCQRAGYGTNYAMGGVINVAPDGTITLVSSLVPGWNDSATGLTNGKFDAGTKTITYDLEYTDYPFHFIVSMTKI